MHGVLVRIDSLDSRLGRIAGPSQTGHHFKSNSQLLRQPDKNLVRLRKQLKKHQFNNIYAACLWMNLFLKKVGPSGWSLYNRLHGEHFGKNVFPPPSHLFTVCEEGGFFKKMSWNWHAYDISMHHSSQEDWKFQLYVDITIVALLLSLRLQSILGSTL